ncbi:MAG: hypothetical protein ACFCBW_07775 [Candidatus Competibacterales bacterium]
MSSRHNNFDIGVERLVQRANDDPSLPQRSKITPSGETIASALDEVFQLGPSLEKAALEALQPRILDPRIFEPHIQQRLLGEACQILALISKQKNSRECALAAQLLLEKQQLQAAAQAQRNLILGG